MTIFEMESAVMRSGAVMLYLRADVVTTYPVASACFCVILVAEGS